MGENIEFPYFRKYVKTSIWTRIALGIWNPKTKRFLGRDQRRWRNIGLIYLVMYICIIIFFMLNMSGLLATLDEKKPRYLLGNSLIGNNPGFGHRPQILGEGSLIMYDSKNITQIQRYTEQIELFLKPYINETNTKAPSTGDQKLIYDFGSCAVANLVEEFRNATPCFFIKINRVYGWVPDYYDDPDNLPDDMPISLKTYIRGLKNKEERKMVWVSCFGERPHDNESMGPLAYLPSPGLPSSAFPYENQPNYLSPLVAVQMLQPKRGQIINIRCRGWAKNLHYTPSLKDRPASTHIEVIVD